jgi:tetratricopeptide (TPR) repeat protein
VDINKALDSVLTSFHSGRLKQAKKLCKEILRKRPDNAQALHYLGVIYHKLGDHEAAIKNIKRSLQTDPAYADAYYNLGNIYQDMKQLDSAIACYRKALQLNPHSAMTYYNLGISLQYQGHLEEVVACYQKALQLNLHTFSLYNNLGVVLQAIGRLDEATSCYQNAIRLNPNFPEAYNNMGIIAQIKGQLDEAVHFYQKAIELKQDFADSYCNLGTIFREKGQFDEAITYFQKAIELNKDFARAYTNLGIALDNKGQHDEAKSYFQKAFQHDSSNSNLSENCINILQDKGNIQDAINSHKKTRDISILIAVPVFNRKKITQLSLAQIQRYKTPYCHLQVYNDHSNEYDNSFVAHYADEVIQLPYKMGVDNLRWYQFKRFLDTDFDFIYMTDNDTIHDPQFITVLEVLYEIGNMKLPVCLFNSVFSLRPDQILYYKNEVMIKKTAPGISMFYDRKMVEILVANLDKANKTLNHLAWDMKAVIYLGSYWVTPVISYLEHFGAQGINNDNYDRDRAIFPTQYLRDRREPILKYLVNDSPLDITF